MNTFGGDTDRDYAARSNGKKATEPVGKENIFRAVVGVSVSDAESYDALFEIFGIES